MISNTGLQQDPSTIDDITDDSAWQKCCEELETETPESASLTSSSTTKPLMPSKSLITELSSPSSSSMRHSLPNVEESSNSTIGAVPSQRSSIEITSALAHDVKTKKHVQKQDVQKHVVIAGNVEMGGISPTTAIKLRETSHGCCRGTDSS